MRFKVVKEFINPWGTPVTPSEAGTFVEYTDVDMQDPAVAEVVNKAIEDGAIVRNELEDTIPPAQPAIAVPGTDTEEPKLAYRSQIVLNVYPRVVGEQTFKHIVCENGTEYDLTDAEYDTEVRPTLK